MSYHSPQIPNNSRWEFPEVLVGIANDYIDSESGGLIMPVIVMHCGRSLASRGPHFVGAKGGSALYGGASGPGGHRHGDCQSRCSGPPGHASGTVTQVVP